MNALFQGIELSKKVSLRMHPIYSIRPKTKFGSVSDHFANLRHEKLWKTCVSGLNALFQGIELQKKFRYERTQSTQLDPKWSLGVFRSILQTFDTKNFGKLVFRAWMHYFEVPNFWKKLRYEGTQCTPLDLKWCLGVFQRILQTFSTKSM